VSFQFEQALVADGFALGSIRVDLGAIDADIAEFQHAHGLSDQENLDKQVLQVRHKGFAEGGDGVVIRVEVAGNEADGGRLVRRSFEIARCLRDP
jgi:hypothetical protein